MKDFTLNPLIRHEAHAFERIREADAAKLTKLALERWENEGGRIPAVGAARKPTERRGVPGRSGW